MSSSTADTEAVERPATVTARAVALTAGIAFALHLPALVRKAALNSDEATIATVARMIRHGARLYTSAVDRKPPGAFIVYRLLEPIFGDWTLTAARWLVLTATVTACWLLALEARRRWPSVNPLAVAIVGVIAFSALPAEDSRAVGFELLGTLPAVTAFVLGARRRFVLAGALLGLAGLFKQPFLLGAVPLVVQCLMSSTQWSMRARRVAIAGAATVAVVVAGLAPFGLDNSLRWYSGSGDNYLSGTEVSTVAIVALEQIGTVVGLTMGMIVLTVWVWRQRRIPADIVAWLVASLLATFIGLRFILHYFNQLLPVLVLLAGAALAGRDEIRRGLRTLAGRFVVLSFVCAVGFSFFTVLTPATFHDIPDVDGIVAAIRAETKPGDRIFVWGQAPEIYWLSGRDPATRYPHIGFITGVTPKRPGVAPYLLSQPGAAEHLLEDLRAHPPVVVVDAAIASVRGGDRYPLATSPVAEFVAENYCESAEFDGIRLLTRCGASGSSTSSSADGSPEP